MNRDGVDLRGLPRPIAGRSPRDDGGVPTLRDAPANPGGAVAVRRATACIRDAATGLAGHGRRSGALHRADAEGYTVQYRSHRTMARCGFKIGLPRKVIRPNAVSPEVSSEPVAAHTTPLHEPVSSSEAETVAEIPPGVVSGETTGSVPTGGNGGILPSESNSEVPARHESGEVRAAIAEESPAQARGGRSGGSRLNCRRTYRRRLPGTAAEPALAAVEARRPQVKMEDAAGTEHRTWNRRAARGPVRSEIRNLAELEAGELSTARRRSARRKDAARGCRPAGIFCVVAELRERDDAGLPVPQRNQL